MKRVRLIRTLWALADVERVDFELVREGGKHQLWRFGEVLIPIPRHREIVERTALSIIKQARSALEEEDRR